MMSLPHQIDYPPLIINGQHWDIKVYGEGAQYFSIGTAFALIYTFPEDLNDVRTDVEPFEYILGVHEVKFEGNRTLFTREGLKKFLEIYERTDVIPAIEAWLA